VGLADPGAEIVQRRQPREPVAPALLAGRHDHRLPVGRALVGALTDQAARQLAKAGKGKMFCTVGLGGKVEPILETTRAATIILAIDGCPLDCTKRSLAEVGFDECLHLRVTDLGMTKGETEISDANVSKVVGQAVALLQ